MLTMQTKELKELVNSSAKARAKKSTLAVLQGLLIQNNGRTIKATGSDLEKALTLALVNPNDDKFGIVVEETFIELVNLVDDFNVSLELNTNNNKLILTAPNKQYIFSVQDELEYPDLENTFVMKDHKSMEIDFGRLKELLKKVVDFTSTDEVRPALTGINLVITPDSLELTASDGTILAQLHEPYNCNIEANFILPAETAREIIKVEKSGKAKIRFNEAIFEIVIEDIRVQSRLIQKKFPDLNKVIPQGSGSYQITAKKEDLNNATKLFNSFTKDKFRVRLGFKYEYQSDKLTAYYDTPEDSFEQLIESKGKTNLLSDIEIGFNFGALRKVLSKIDGDKVNIEIEERRPAIFHTGSKEKEFYLIQPIALQNK